MKTPDGALHRWLYAVWYGRGRGGWILRPLEWLYRGVTALRRAAYRRGLLARHEVGVPVIVIGNISAGGSGKTPLVGWLASSLAARGLRPAVISRGYGGSAGPVPLVVTPQTPAAVCGDEPAMLKRELEDVPVVVAADRVAAARTAIESGARVLVSDDGLQHYRLARDIEIAVIDAERRHGNGRCLPAGPLREPPSRLDEVDLIVESGGMGSPDGCAYRLSMTDALNAVTGERRPLAAFAGSEVWAFAAIAHPARFFDGLRAHGIDPVATALRDHAVAGEDTVSPPGDAPVMMTAKDAVKYEGHLSDRHWIVGARVDMDADSLARLEAVIEPVLAALPGGGDQSTLGA